MTDKSRGFYSREMANKMRKEGRLLTSSGGYSTQEETKAFLAGLKKRLKEQTISLNKEIRQVERDLAKF